jgi:hypothetical protein
MAYSIETTVLSTGNHLIECLPSMPRDHRLTMKFSLILWFLGSCLEIENDIILNWLLWTPRTLVQLKINYSRIIKHQLILKNQTTKSHLNHSYPLESLNDSWILPSWSKRGRLSLTHSSKKGNLGAGSACSLLDLQSITSTLTLLRNSAKYSQWRTS